KVSEGPNNFSGRPRPFVAMQQNETRGRNVEGQPEQCDHEKDRRKHRELDRTPHLKSDEQDHDRQGDIEAQQQIEQKSRQRQQHHHENGHYPDGYDDVRMLDQLVPFHRFYCRCHNLLDQWGVTPLARYTNARISATARYSSFGISLPISTSLNSVLATNLCSTTGT